MLSLMLGLWVLLCQSRWAQASIRLLATVAFAFLYGFFLFEYIEYDRSDVALIAIVQRMLLLFGGIFAMDKTVVTAGSAGIGGAQDTIMAALFGVLFLSAAITSLFGV